MTRAARGAAAAALLIAGCASSRLVTVPRGAQPAQAKAVSVDFPPPPAKIEEIALSHRSTNRCVWRDGFWDWTGRRWEWQTGRAVLSPTGCYFAEAKLEWGTDSLSFYRPAWYPDSAEPKAPKVCLEVACLPPSGGARAEQASD